MSGPQRETHRVYDVFTPTTQARLNFVPRKIVNDQMVDALLTPGKQLIIYGESGSGKSTLLLKKLDEVYSGHITTRCSGSMTFERILLDGFDQLNSYYVDGYSSNKDANISAGLSADFHRLRASVDASLSESTGETARRVVPPQLTIQRLGQFMGAAGLCWVVEDFHKMPVGEKVPLAQGFKVFSDLAGEWPQVKIVALGATETARQVVEYDVEMTNRISELLVPLMDEEELSEILSNGQKLLNIDLSAIGEPIVAYSSGVPSVCHVLALNACLEKQIMATQSVRFGLTPADLEPALHRYIRESSDTLKRSFDQALKRHHVRIYDNGRLILTAMASGPLDGMAFSEILAHIRKVHPKYPGGNLTNYLAQLTGDDRGGLVRQGPDGKYRFVDPLHHTFAQVTLGDRSEVAKVVEPGALPQRWWESKVTSNLVSDLIIKIVYEDVTGAMTVASPYYEAKNATRNRGAINWVTDWNQQSLFGDDLFANSLEATPAELLLTPVLSSAAANTEDEDEDEAEQSETDSKDTEA